MKVYDIHFWHPDVKESDFPEIVNGKNVTFTAEELMTFFNNHPNHCFMIKQDTIYVDTKMFKVR